MPTITNSALHPTLRDRDAKAAQAIVAWLIGEGYALAVNDGEEWTLVESRDPAAVLAALGTTEADSLRVSYRDDAGMPKPLYTLYLVWGNDGDVYADATHGTSDRARAAIAEFENFAFPVIDRITGNA